MSYKELKFLFLSLRPSHWLKNALIFLPLIFSHKLFAPHTSFYSFWAFFAFCATASSIYLLNDLLDITNDQHHVLKKIRPIASGKVQPLLAAVTICFLSILALAISRLINDHFLIIVITYYLLGVSYSIWLKHVVILDVMVLSAFYILRILGGIVVINAKMSYWMIICIGLLAMFIGFNKRKHEIKFLKKSQAVLHREVLSEYDPSVIDQMINVVNAAILISYTLYTIDPDTVARFGTRAMILTVPFVCYGIFRYLFVVHCKDHGGDPVRTFLTDTPSIINGLIWFLVCIMIIYFNRGIHFI